MPRRNTSLARALERLDIITATQAGAFTTAQARTAGLPTDAIRRQLSAGRWTGVHRGVYLAGPTPAALATRMWAAHLALGGRSVVGGASAARYWGLTDEDPSPDEPITMVMPDGSNRVARGVRVTRVPDPAALAHPARTPPVLTVENTVLGAAADGRTDSAAIEMVLRACRLRLTTPERLLAAAGSRQRLRRRALLENVCTDVRDGVSSPLERLYRLRVVRAHGLPTGRTQVPAMVAGQRRVYRDVLYEAQDVIVELDGRLGHEDESDALRDLTRDNHATLTGHATLRFGWLAVAGHACEVAGQVHDLLVLRGWAGSVRPCGPTCYFKGATDSGRAA